MTNAEFEEVYKEYRSFSIMAANELVNNRTVAEDLCQEAFCSLYKMGERLDISDKRRLGALIRTITVNKTKDYLKRSYHRMEIREIDETSEMGDKKNSVEATMLHLEEKEYRRLVLQRLRDENPMNYDILIKAKFLGIPPELIAEEFHISVNNVNNRILRTKHWLQKEMSRVYKN